MEKEFKGARHQSPFPRIKITTETSLKKKQSYRLIFPRLEPPVKNGSTARETDTKMGDSTFFVA